VAGVVIGVDPHKLSATIKVLDDREQVLGGGRFGTDGEGMVAELRGCWRVPAGGLTSGLSAEN
jgi:hypothetical protein